MKEFYKGLEVVTKDNYCVGRKVVRGPTWHWGNQDTDYGNDNGIGVLVDNNLPLFHFRVTWIDNNHPTWKTNDYNYGDLCYCPSSIKTLLEELKK
jgi:hypothetical protein